VRIGKFEFRDAGKFEEVSERFWTEFVRDGICRTRTCELLRHVRFQGQSSSMYRAGEMRRMDDELESKSDNRLVA
jgi:hypothetical protein